MNELSLSKVLDTHQDEIALAFMQNLAELSEDQASCPNLVQTRAGGCQPILQTIRSCCGRGDSSAARDTASLAARSWASGLRDEAITLDMPCSEVLLGLSCLERAAALHVVKAINQKTVLAAALAELGKAVDLLRRCYLDVQSGSPYCPGMGTPSSGVPSSGMDGEQSLDFRSLADSMDAFVCMATLHGKPLYLNPTGRRLVGLDENASTVPSNLHYFYTEDSWIELRDVAVPAVKLQRQWQGQSQLRNARTGQIHDVLTNMLLVTRSHSEVPYCLAIIHNDAADQRRLQQTLTEAEARKHAILESALDPIITIDHNGLISEFNRAAEQTFGHSRKKVLGTKPSEVLFPASKSAGHQNRIDRYINAGEGSLLGRRIEVTAVRSGGETFPAEMAMTISQEQGAPVLTFFVRDISQRKKAEREQARYAADLERSNRELEQFAYVASHDLQEPLRKIRTFSDRLEMSLSKRGESLDETGRDCLDRMQSAAVRMQTLIEGLLTLSRVTTHGKRFERVDLAQIVRDVVSDLEVQIEQAAARVEVGNLPVVRADPVQMRQLMQNLIGNALKFRRIDESPVVKVHGRYIEGRKQRRSDQEQYAALPDSSEQYDAMCRILVEDNGIGFDEKHLERVFGVFQRLHPRDVYEGTGIGLPICRRIVERHRGTITARSKPGVGSTFEVTLPVTHWQEEK